MGKVEVIEAEVAVLPLPDEDLDSELREWVNEIRKHGKIGAFIIGAKNFKEFRCAVCRRPLHETHARIDIYEENMKVAFTILLCRQHINYVTPENYHDIINKNLRTGDISLLILPEYYEKWMSAKL